MATLIALDIVDPEAKGIAAGTAWPGLHIVQLRHHHLQEAGHHDGSIAEAAPYHRKHAKHRRRGTVH
eukprot:136048-Prymnesium_polylepis.3